MPANVHCPLQPAQRLCIEILVVHELTTVEETVRQQFLAPLDTDQLAGIADLDQRFHTWLESEYHRSPHRGLKGTTPLETWLAKCHLIVPVDPAVNLAEAFRHQAARKVHRDPTITLDGVLFELPSTLIGERVVLRYDPTLPPSNRRLFVHHGGAPRRRGAPGRLLRQRSGAPRRPPP